MSTALVPLSASSSSLPETCGLDGLRSAVLNGVTAENSKKNYALALDELSAFSRERGEPISRTLSVWLTKATRYAGGLAPLHTCIFATGCL